MNQRQDEAVRTEMFSQINCQSFLEDVSIDSGLTEQILDKWDWIEII